jgi:hypothetical protein
MSNPAPQPRKGDELRYLVWNLVDHYQNDHPDADQTEECHFAIETIEELEALCQKRELALLPHLQALKKDMQRFEGVTEDGGIDTTVYDEADDPRGVKNGEMLANLAQFASDNGFNQGVDAAIAVITKGLK